MTSAGVAGTVVAANHNAPAQTAISGPTEAVRAATAALSAAGLTARPIPVACAFHSPVVAAGSESFARVLAASAITAPAGEVWANRTAAAYPDDPDAVRAELAAQIAAPVRFVDQIEAMYAAGARIFVEAGPGQVLTGLVGAVLGDRPHLAVATDGRSDGLSALLLAVAQLACAGVPVNTGWLFHGRSGPPPRTGVPSRPVWTVDGHLVRDPAGACLPGGLGPARRIPEELTMTTNSPQAPDSAGALLADYLRTTREMITSQREVMLAFLGPRPARPAWQPTPAYQPEDLMPAMVVPALAAEASAAPVSPAPASVPRTQVPVRCVPALDVQAARSPVRWPPGSAFPWRGTSRNWRTWSGRAPCGPWWSGSTVASVAARPLPHRPRSPPPRSPPPHESRPRPPHRQRPTPCSMCGARCWP